MKKLLTIGFIAFSLLVVGNAQSEENKTEPPPIGQTLIREGFFAVKLAEALKIGPASSEAEAESTLGLMGIAPKNGWVADYPLTPDIIGELQNSIGEAVDSGRLSMKKDETIKAFQALIAGQGLPVRPGKEAQEGVEPLRDYDQYYGPPVMNNYYYEEGPPVVTYYPPPWDYYYLYAWVPYPFWYTGFWFPGFFALCDFHRVTIAHRHVIVISNHFRDPGTKRLVTIDPARRHMGNAALALSHPRSEFTSHVARDGATSILRNSYEHPNFNRPTARYGTPSTGYSARSGAPTGRSRYGSSFSYWSTSSRHGIGTGRSFSLPSRSGSSGFHGGGSRSGGFSGGSRGSSRGGGHGGGGRGGGGHR